MTAPRRRLPAQPARRPPRERVRVTGPAGRGGFDAHRWWERHAAGRGAAEVRDELAGVPFN